MKKKAKRKKRKWIKICPKCGSTEVTQRGMISRKAYSQNYVCLSCGFQSPLFPEITQEEAKKIPYKPKKIISSRLPIFADYFDYEKLKLLTIISFIIMIFILFLLLLFG